MDYCKKCQRPLTMSTVGFWCEHCDRRPKPGIRAADPFERVPTADKALVDGTEIDFAGKEQMQPGKPT